MISTLKEKISKFESEREITRSQMEMEREAFLSIQDILRVDFKRHKELLTIKY
jgi:hypothetical protein